MPTQSSSSSHTSHTDKLLSPPSSPVSISSAVYTHVVGSSPTPSIDSSHHTSIPSCSDTTFGSGLPYTNPHYSNPPSTVSSGDSCVVSEAHSLSSASHTQGRASSTVIPIQNSLQHAASYHSSHSTYQQNIPPYIQSAATINNNPLPYTSTPNPVLGSESVPHSYAHHYPQSLDSTVSTTSNPLHYPPSYVPSSHSSGSTYQQNIPPSIQPAATPNNLHLHTHTNTAWNEGSVPHYTHAQHVHHYHPSHHPSLHGTSHSSYSGNSTTTFPLLTAAGQLGPLVFGFVPPSLSGLFKGSIGHDF